MILDQSNVISDVIFINLMLDVDVYNDCQFKWKHKNNLSWKWMWLHRRFCDSGSALVVIARSGPVFCKFLLGLYPVCNFV